jgi:hypothetical protein
MNSAMSLEWDRQKRQHNVPKKLSTPEELTANLDKYIKTRKEGGEVDFDPEYKIAKQYGIGSVYDTGSYDRYVVFKNNPGADFVCTIYPMGLIQVSCNPFKEKVLKQIDLGAITTEILAKYKYQLSNINVPISDIKRISEDEIAKMKTKYGPDYEAIGFTFGDLKAFYPKAINYLPNRKSNDMKTKEILDLNSDNPMVKMVEDCMSKPFDEWSYKEKDEMSWLRIPAMTIIEVNSGGHPSITNIQGLNYLGSRRDLLKRLFNTEDYTDVMKLFADEFIDNLKGKIDDVKMGKNVEYQKTDVELHGDVSNESFDYYLKSDNGNVKPVTKDEFIKAGFDSKFEPKRPDNGNKGFSIDIEDKKIIGKFN